MPVHKTRLPLRRKAKISKLLEYEFTLLGERAEIITDPYSRTFFNSIFSCSAVDIYDFYMLCKSKDNQHIRTMPESFNYHCASQWAKWMAFYHTLQFVCQYEPMEAYSLENSLFQIFGFTPGETQTYKNLKRLNQANSSKFEMAFTKLAMKHMLGIHKRDLVPFAFLSAFLIHTYQDFVKNYTKFMPVNIYA